MHKYTFLRGEDLNILAQTVSKVSQMVILQPRVLNSFKKKSSHHPLLAQIKLTSCQPISDLILSKFDLHSNVLLCSISDSFLSIQPGTIRIIISGMIPGKERLLLAQDYESSNMAAVITIAPTPPMSWCLLTLGLQKILLFPIFQLKTHALPSLLMNTGCSELFLSQAFTNPCVKFKYVPVNPRWGGSRNSFLHPLQMSGESTAK